MGVKKHVTCDPIEWEGMVKLVLQIHKNSEDAVGWTRGGPHLQATGIGCVEQLAQRPYVSRKL